MLSRRRFLTHLGLLSAGMLLPFECGGVAFAGEAVPEHRLVVIMLRGAVDGLSVVAPYAEANYAAKRPSIALERPGQEGGLLHLDGMFGLHPSLASLMPLWNNRQMAFVHASGLPVNTRSHFEAQDILETSSLNHFSDPQGWMNRLVQQLPASTSPTRAVSFGNVLPKIFMGLANIATIQGGGKAEKNNFANPKVQNALANLYASNPQLQKLFKEGVSSRQVLSDEMTASPQEEMELASKQAPNVDGFSKQCENLARLINRDPTVQAVFMDVGGWDTHIDQGNAKGQLAGKLEKLGQALATLAAGLGNEMQRTTVVLMSEFGRTVAENGNGGTDHGHGNVLWLIGGRVQGGKVWARWPGLNGSQLYEGRDLAVTTDFRSILATVLAADFKLTAEQINTVLLNPPSDPGLRSIIL